MESQRALQQHSASKEAPDPQTEDLTPFGLEEKDREWWVGMATDDRDWWRSYMQGTKG